MKFMIEMTWSKLMALVVLGYAFYMDVTLLTSENLRWCLPFVIFLITGKQVIDWRKNNTETVQDKK